MIATATSGISIPKHGHPGQPASAPVGEKHLALLGGIAAAGQQGDHLEPGPLVRQPGKAKQNGKQLCDDPIEQYYY